ncbi:hypothetical protein CPB97_008865 [Podila verticillata]|nr:hypothetical protein CPB97_008865 [Podila verticillata]
MGHRATEETNSDGDSENEANSSEDTYTLSTSSGIHLTTKDKSDARSKPYLNPGDTFGRRASMSQLSLYGDVWGQVK